MIIGGGMGGMMAAEILKARGHEPAIYEASDHLAASSSSPASLRRSRR